MSEFESVRVAEGTKKMNYKKMAQRKSPMWLSKG